LILEYILTNRPDDSVNNYGLIFAVLPIQYLCYN